MVLFGRFCKAMALFGRFCISRIIPDVLLQYFQCFWCMVLIMKLLCIQVYKDIQITTRKNYLFSGFSDEEIRRGNEYVDKVLEDFLEDHGDENDPYPFGDKVIGFHKQVVFVNVSGEAKLFNCYVTGLKSLHRTGDCSLKREGDRLRVLADLGAGVLDFYCSGTVKFMTMGPTVTVHGILAYVEMYMEFTVNSNTGKDGNLEKFVADDVRGINVIVTGLGPLNWFLNTFVSAITSIFSGVIKNLLEKQVKSYLSQRIREYDFPVDATVTTPAQEVM